MYAPEYLKIGLTVLLREGRTKILGTIVTLIEGNVAKDGIKLGKKDMKKFENEEIKVEEKKEINVNKEKEEEKKTEEEIKK